MSRPRERVVAIARSQLGVREVPWGSNRTKYGAWYRQNGQPWCAMFVAWVYVRAGLPDPRQVITPLWAGTMHGTAAARRKGWLFPASQARPGDAIMWNWWGVGDPVDHVSICESAGGGVIQGIDGNVGNQVIRTVRPWAQAVGAVRIPHLDVGAPIVVPPSPAPPPPPAPLPTPPVPQRIEETPDMFIITERDGIYALMGSVSVRFESLAEYAAAKQKSEGVPVMYLPDKQGKVAAPMLLKQTAKATG